MKKFIIAMSCILLTVAPVSNVFAMDPLLVPEKEQTVTKSESKKKSSPEWNGPIDGPPVVKQQETVAKAEKEEPKVKKMPNVMILPGPQGSQKGQRNPFAYQKNLPPEFPKVDFSTAMIGQFMTFCGKIMMQRFRYENVVPQIAQFSTGFVCSCIMDNYRSKASEAEFRYEFTRNEARDVPLFTEYLGQCSAMNTKNLMLMKNYYQAKPTFFGPHPENYYKKL
tara:strand:- start:47 stop:715 length:669 start_codon:yes stop_codon:yes gene_type:complete